MRDFFSQKILLGNFATWILVILVVVLLSYVIERCLFLHSGKIKPQQFLNGVVSLLQSGRYNEALTVCESSPGVAALVVKTALVFRKKSRSELFHAVNEVALLEIPLLERRLNSIRLIAKIAPMMSFLGVLQILAKTLSGIGHASTYFSASVVISFMQQAVMLVAFGLVINILGTLAYNFLCGRVRRLIHDMEWSCNEILNYIATASDKNRSENAEAF
ncbi:MAG: MotA/TolQ/ExbB proton channel family protein [Puniceicoccales bacterium]|jgi:biopolymer transport protein ExbB|nr:MotA/TolQ/ExbB proton channel family protein [Puniceicoccales bacterium]